MATPKLPKDTATNIKEFLCWADNLPDNPALYAAILAELKSPRWEEENEND